MQQVQDHADLLSGQPNKEFLYLITCGSPRGGKSTLLGRLLSGDPCGVIKSCQDPDTQTCPAWKEINPLSGLKQEITINVTYHAFSSAWRQYLIADIPNSGQPIRNIVSCAYSADLVIILVDVCQGVQAQIRYYSRIMAMTGIHQVVLLVNKMDLLAFDELAFSTVASEFKAVAAEYGFLDIQAIPISALDGDNVFQTSVRTPWYTGLSLMDYLDTIAINEVYERDKFRLLAQHLSSNNQDVSGCVIGGSVYPGDSVRVLPSGMQSQIKTIVNMDGEMGSAHAGNVVTLTLTDKVKVNEGDLIVAAGSPTEMADQFEAKLVWMSEHAMSPGRQYWMKHACKGTTAAITEIKYREDLNTGAHLAARTLGANEFASINLSTSDPVAFEPYSVNRTLGSFLLIDKLTREIMGAGMIDFALRRASNIHWQALELNKTARAVQKHQNPRCIWFTGLSGSGKSTIANLLDKRLHAEGRHTYVLDGDNVRHGLNRDLGFTEADRVENIRRVAEVAHLMVDAGLIVLVSFISPFQTERRMARELFAEGEFVEVFVDTSLEECERRDVKGLYAKARRGELKNFTGIDSGYEIPGTPEIHLHPDRDSVQDCVEQILRELSKPVFRLI